MASKIEIENRLKDASLKSDEFEKEKQRISEEFSNFKEKLTNLNNVNYI